MSAVRPGATTLAAAIWPSEVNQLLRSLALVALGVVVLTVSAKVKVPFYPVPVTLQTLAVPLIAAAYGARLGTAAVVAYLAAGFVGLPVFANTPPAVPGPLYFLGTTGGYLVAYPLAAAIIGTLVESDPERSLLRTFGAMVIGDIVIMIFGFAWLAFAAHLSNGGTGLGMSAAWNAGVLPFLLGDLVKLALAAALIRAGWKAAERRQVQPRP
jgi:biotin transport system substrate-specific component